MADAPRGNVFDMRRSLDEQAARGPRERLGRLVSETADVEAEERAASAVAIDAERERYGELFDFAPDAYLVTDTDGKILEANSAAGRLLGVPPRHLDGKLLVSFVD